MSSLQSLEAALRWLYSANGFVVAFTYLPQLAVILRDATGARTVSLATWGYWTLSSALTLSYAIAVARDTSFATVSAFHLAGCVSIVSVTILQRRRAQGRAPADRRGVSAAA